MTEKLKPCPFCGSENVKAFTDDIQALSWVECLSCHGMMMNLGTEEENIEAWNRRAET